MTNYLCKKSLYFFPLSKRRTNYNNSISKNEGQWNAFDMIILEEIGKKFHKKPLVQRNQASNKITSKESPSQVKFANSLLSSLNTNQPLFVSQKKMKRKPLLPVIDSNIIENTVPRLQSIDDQEKELKCSIPCLSMNQRSDARNTAANSNLNVNSNYFSYYLKLSNLKQNNFNFQSTKEQISLKQRFNKEEKELSQLSYYTEVQLKEKLSPLKRDIKPLQPIMNQKLMINKTLSHLELKKIKIVKNRDMKSGYKLADCDYSILSKSSLLKSNHH